LKRKARNPLNLSADRSAHVLHILIAEGKLTAKHVSDALKRREQMIHELRQRLDALERGVVSTVEKTGRTVARKVERKAKRKMSAARRAALKLHGQYLGHIRTLPKTAKAKVKAIRERAGVHAAIRAAKKLSKTVASRGRALRREQGTLPNYQSSQQRQLAKYQQRERPKPDKHGGSGSGRQQGGSGAGRERG
jgi:hypothetical protein